MTKQYSINDQLSGKDLHGLSCRVPTPTTKQAKCSHTKGEWVTVTEEDDWTEEITKELKYIESCTYEDVPYTNNIRCSLCGYTRRY